MGERERAPVLKNRFRKLVGILLIIVFAVAVVQYFRQTSGSPYMVAALTSGMWLLAVLAAVVGLAWWVDRRKHSKGD